MYGCYVDTPAPFTPKTPVLVKIFKSDEYFEAKATVVYAHPTLGMGLAFRDVKPDFRMVMQKWLPAALQDNGPKPSATALSETAQILSCEPATVQLDPSFKLRTGRGSQGHLRISHSSR